METDSHDAALDAVHQVLALAEEHGLELPPQFHFRQSQAEFAAGSLVGAKEAVTRYLTVSGRGGEFYAEALESLEAMDGILERRDAPECTGQPEGSTCWMEVTHQSGCYVFNDYLQPEETATWTGACSSGLVQGRGTLTWRWPPANLQALEGTYRFGKRHGPWIEQNEDDWFFVQAGRYVDGERHGSWIAKNPDGDIVATGAYSDGEPHGHWVTERADGSGEQGTYVDGERSGQWTFKLADGSVGEGPFVDGKQHGRWVWRDANGWTREGPYAAGEQHGRWVHKRDDGSISEGEFLEGRWHGQWTVRYPDGRTAEGQYKDAGETEDAHRHGIWVLRFPDGQVESGPYVEGQRHGLWTIRFPDGDVDYVEFVRGVRQVQ